MKISQTQKRSWCFLWVAYEKNEESRDMLLLEKPLLNKKPSTKINYKGEPPGLSSKNTPKSHFQEEFLR